MATMKPVAAVKKYFFDSPTMEGLPKLSIKEISEQWKALSTEEKVFLAEGAAKELGVEIDWSTSK